VILPIAAGSRTVIDEEAIMKILVAADGSDYSVKAAEYIATHFMECPVETHLLHVHLPIPRGLALARAEKLFGGDVDDRYYKEESEAALAPVEQIFRKRNLPFESTYRVGEIAEEINRYASENKIDMIAMGSHGRGGLTNLVMGSVATKVMAMSRIPVLIVR
jgi:nucleotide-binding universal stress UspA family protein